MLFFLSQSELFLFQNRSSRIKIYFKKVPILFSSPPHQDIKLQLPWRLPVNVMQEITTFNKRWQFYLALVHSVFHVQRPEQTLTGQQLCFFIFGMQPTGDDLSDLALLQAYWRQSYVISSEIRTAGKLSSKLKFLIISNSATHCLKRKGILKDWRHKQSHGKDTEHHCITRSSMEVCMCWISQESLKNKNNPIVGNAFPRQNIPQR